MPFIPIIIIILVVVLILVLATNLKVVQQSKAYVIERLGAFHSVWGVSNKIDWKPRPDEIDMYFTASPKA